MPPRRPGRSMMVTSRAVQLRVIAVLLICAASLALFDAPFRYTAVRPDLIAPVFTAGWQIGRQVAVDPGGNSARLTAATDGGAARLPYLSHLIGVRGGYDFLRVTAEMRAFDAVPGSQPWQTGRLVVRSYDRGYNMIRYLPAEAEPIAGASGWRAVSVVVPAVPEIRWMRLLIYNGARSGIVAVRALGVDGVVQSDLFRVLRGGLIALWALGAAWCLAPLWRFRRRLGALAMAGVGIAVVAGALVPQPFVADLAAPLVHLLEESAPKIALNGDGAAGAGLHSVPLLSPAPFDTAPAAHLFAFVALGLVAAIAFPAVAMLDLLVYLLLVGAVTETLQGFSFTRTPQLSDLAMDAIGAAAGLALGHIVAAWRIRERRNRHGA